MIPYTLLALDIAHERSTEARRRHERHRRNAAVLAEGTTRPSIARHAVARTLAAVSRSSAAAVRRLDDCVAEDLSRSFAPTE